MGIRNLQLPTSLGSSLTIQDITDQLPHNPAYTWAQLAGVRDLDALTDIVCHHSGVPKSAGATAERHAKNHINGRAYEPQGEPGIPYHIYINGGQIYQCNDLLDRTYGVASNNAYTIHICVEGDYANTDTLTDPDRAALYAAILAVKAALPAYQHLKGHNEYNPTDCPGYDMDRVRADVAALELKMQRANTDAAKRERGFAVANQAAYMYNLSQAQGDAGNAAWAQHWLDQVYDIMKSQGLL